MSFTTKRGVEFGFDDLKIGDSFWVQKTATKYHIRGFVDELIVLRHWNRSTRKWNYSIWESGFCNAFFYNYGYLQVKRNG